MPNARNIDAPVTLVANGRSGTSLIQSIFKNHPSFDVCGETAALVFGVWHSVERVQGLVRPDQALEPGADFRLRCGKAVRAALLDTFRKPGKKHWMQKPIGVPWVWHSLGERGLTQAERIEWYWHVLGFSFPLGVNITILRHPYDVVLSAESYWGITLKQAWSSIVIMARILAHPSAKITHAVTYDKLVQEPLAETERLFEAINRPFSTKTLHAFEHIWVPDKETRHTELTSDHPKMAAQFSRAQDWTRLEVENFPQEDRDVLMAMWQKYGAELTL